MQEAAGSGATLIVFPEAFVPGTPIWIDSVPIGDGDEAWYVRLVDQAVVVPRKLMPTGSERTVWGMGNGSTLDDVPTPLGRLGD